MNVLSLISRNALMAIVMDCEEIIVGNKTREQLEAEVEESLKKRAAQSTPESNNEPSVGVDFVLTPHTDVAEMSKLSKAVGEALAGRGPLEALSYFKFQTVFSDLGVVAIPMECLGLNPEQFGTRRKDNLPKDFGKNFEDLMGSQDGTPQ